METTIKVSNREIAIRAFDHLRHERKTDAALRLAHHPLRPRCLADKESHQTEHKNFQSHTVTN